MQGLQSPTSAQAGARPIVEDRFHIFAVFGAFAVIAAIVFGTLPFHPF